MEKFNKIIYIVAIIFCTWLVKFVFHLPSLSIDIIGVVLSVASILFGLLAGFFISQLLQRYTEIRSLQGERSSAGILLIEFAEHFYKKNPKFKKEFIKRMEMSAVADEIILWDEGHLEIPYYHKLEDSFESLTVSNAKDEVYFEGMLEQLNSYVTTTVKMDALYKQRLAFTEWVVFVFLSIFISIAVLLLEPNQLFYIILILTFPCVVLLTLSIIYDLNTISMGRNLITLEPNQVIFDALGVRRFYMDRNKGSVSADLKHYRTEKSLKGDLRDILKSIEKSRK